MDNDKPETHAAEPAAQAGPGPGPEPTVPTVMAKRIELAAAMELLARIGGERGFGLATLIRGSISCWGDPQNWDVLPVCCEMCRLTILGAVAEARDSLLVTPRTMEEIRDSFSGVWLALFKDELMIGNPEAQLVAMRIAGALPERG